MSFIDSFIGPILNKLENISNKNFTDVLKVGIKNYIVRLERIYL